MGFVAILLGCTEQTIRFWEQDRALLKPQHMAKLIEFLGHDPLPEATSIGEQLIRYRQRHGLTQRALARPLRVDPSSVWAREKSKHQPIQKSLEKVRVHLNGYESPN